MRAKLQRRPIGPIRRWAAMAWIVSLLVTVAATSPALSENIDPDGDDSQYAYGENVGWLNAEPSGEGGPGLEVDDFRVTGWMWGENIGWVSFSCENTATCGDLDYGVANDGGALSGWAWSENAGWISLSCENTASCGVSDYAVSIDTNTGEFSGRAWSENLGWITFASAGVPFKVKTSWTCSIPGGVFDLRVGRLGPDAELTWAPAAGATAYDVVSGELGVLRTTGGDFQAATTGCVADNEFGLSTIHSGSPPPDQATWFLARAANCGGGTYNSGGPQQVADRDAGIGASALACP